MLGKSPAMTGWENGTTKRSLLGVALDGWDKPGHNEKKGFASVSRSVIWYYNATATINIDNPHDFPCPPPARWFMERSTNT